MRTRLTTVCSLDDVVEQIRQSKRIMVVTGAGISVSCGIPDFRSKAGLYNTLNCDSIGIPSAELLFDLEYFKIDPAPFYKYCKCLLPKDDVPSLTHKFISLLESKNKLLRNYTQNVDGIEEQMGIKNLIACHGSMNDFQCINESCKRKKCNLSSVVADIEKGLVCYCPCGEALKPSITFFGEPLPRYFFSAMQKDVSRCDLVLVMGTSLKVGGSVHELLRQVRDTAPQVLINRDPVQPPKDISEGFDVSLLGLCDDVVQLLCDQLGWDLHSAMPAAGLTTKLSSDSTSKKRKSFCDVPGEVKSAGKKKCRKAVRSKSISKKCFSVFQSAVAGDRAFTVLPTSSVSEESESLKGLIQIAVSRKGKAKIVSATAAVTANTTNSSAEDRQKRLLARTTRI